MVELGCGHGSAALPVLRGPGARGSRVVGVDRSSEAVALAASAMRELGYAPERFEAHVGDVADGEGLAERLGLAGRADCVLYVFTLNSVSPQDAAAALRAAAAMLKPGGRVLFRDYGPGDVRHTRVRALARALVHARRCF